MSKLKSGLLVLDTDIEKVPGSRNTATMTPLKLTPEVVAAAAVAYRSGEAVPAIASRLRVDWSTLYRAFRRHGVRADRNFEYLTANQKAEVVGAYLNGESQTELAGRFGVDRGTIRYTLKVAGHSMRPQGDACRKLPLAQDAFDRITEASAYWIGFLMADGYIRLRKGEPWGVRLVISDKDLGHLEKFRAFLGSAHSIIFGPPYLTKKSGYRRQAIFSFTSSRIACRLHSFGVTNRKSLTARVAKLENNRDYWRGLIDGDGCVRWQQIGRYRYPNLVCYGSEATVEQFAEWARAVAPSCRTAITRRGKIARFNTTGRSAENLVLALYGGCTVALDRKSLIAQEIIRAARS